MNSKMLTLIVSVIISIVLWLVGGFVLDHTGGMVCVFISIALLGWAIGYVMDTPEPAHDSDHK